MENELILRPQEENWLAVLRTSPKNYCKALCPKKVEDVFQSDEPSIGTIIRKFGEPQARAVLVILIADALEFFNVSNTMSATQVATTVDLIIEEYPYMKKAIVFLYNYFARLLRNLSPLHTGPARKV